MDDNRVMQEMMMNFIQGQQSQPKTIDPNKQLSNDIDILEEKCQQLENKNERLKRYEKMV